MWSKPRKHFLVWTVLFGFAPCFLLPSLSALDSSSDASGLNTETSNREPVVQDPAEDSHIESEIPQATEESVAATENSSSSTQVTSSTPTSSQAAFPSTGEVSSPGNVSIDFKDADIQNVLRILSLKSGVNIVAGKDVVGNVTIRLVDVPWEKALDVVLKTYGYAYDRDVNIIRVTTVENLKKEELSTEVFTLNYSTASEVEKSLKDILSDRGKARSDTRSNTVVVTDMPTVLQNVKKVIERLDRITPQVIIETRVIETTLGNADKMGLKWNITGGLKGASRPATFPFSAIAPQGNAGLRSILPQGRGAVTVGAVAGVSSGSSTADFPSITAGTNGDAFQATFPVADKADFKFGALDFSEFQAVFDMIKQRTDTKILSEPHVIAMNNQEAKILVGEVIAIPTFERNSSTGRMEITGYRDRDLGIRLSVTPQINSNNDIVITVHPEITNLLGYDELTTDIKVPRFSTREAQTRVRIKSSQTIAIGGLIKEDTIDANTKVPILGDLPGIGKLFSHKSKSVQKTDLLFFMTVTVLNENKVPLGHRLDNPAPVAPATALL